MAKQPEIKTEILINISKILGDTNKGLAGKEIGILLSNSKMGDPEPTLSKWCRLYYAFTYYQKRTKCSNDIFVFIQSAMNPARYIGKKEQFEYLRNELNKTLSFLGLKIMPDGAIGRVKRAKTINDAEKRADTLKHKLEIRNAHPDIFKYCTAELLEENYFHSVFEATKSVADKIRKKTGLIGDGAQLVQSAFSTANPILKINDLITETEKSEQRGFTNLLIGLFGMFRNTAAHAPRISWEINEQNALDTFGIISLIHRRLDNC